LITRKFGIISGLFLPVLAVGAAAVGAAPAPGLIALAVFLEALALHAVAGERLLLHQRVGLAALAVLAALAGALLPAGLPCPVALAVLGVAVGLDAPAPDVALGLHSVEQVVDPPLF
jgi:hypothetical protein